jgi:hypothetical protein
MSLPSRDASSFIAAVWAATATRRCGYAMPRTPGGEGGRYASHDYASMLSDAGFVDIKRNWLDTGALSRPQAVRGMSVACGLSLHDYDILVEGGSLGCAIYQYLPIG